MLGDLPPLGIDGTDPSLHSETDSEADSDCVGIDISTDSDEDADPESQEGRRVAAEKKRRKQQQHQQQARVHRRAYTEPQFNLFNGEAGWRQTAALLQAQLEAEEADSRELASHPQRGCKECHTDRPYTN